MLAEGAGGRPWLVVVGIGADGMAGLGEAARRAVAAGEVLVGGARHLAMVPDDGRPRVPWRSPLAATLGEIGAHRGRPVVVLATGDPLWHGVGRLLVRHFGAAEVRVLPHVSAFQLAAARLGWALEEVVSLSVHGRPLAGLGRHLAPGRRLLVLAEDGETPAAAAALLRERGYGRSRAWVLEELGGPGERIVEAGVGGLGDGRFADLCTLALALEADGPEVALPVGVALPDAAFAHDGQLTKREVRAATLAALAPLPGELLWDVGAGAGGVAIDWLRADPSLRAVAVERNAGRAARHPGRTPRGSACRSSRWWRARRRAASGPCRGRTRPSWAAGSASRACSTPAGSACDPAAGWWPTRSRLPGRRHFWHSTRATAAGWSGSPSPVPSHWGARWLGGRRFRSRSSP